MAMDALKNLTIHIPDWLKSLDDLSGQIDQRQAELAAFAEAEGISVETKSLRNKGSTESLKPKDDGQLHFSPEEPSNGTTHPTTASPISKPTTPPHITNPTTGSPPSPTAIKQSQEAIKAARIKVRQQIARKPRSPSMASNEVTPAYRTRNMIIVYYDSYVQGYFDELVRFVSSSRNMMRKAKMAAKVAQIKKLAEAEVENGGDSDALPSLRYMSTRRYGPVSMARFGPGAKDQTPDVYDKLDKGLEFVQSSCEHGAHQFLRDGDCNDEISKVQKRLSEVLEMAKKETERVLREDPELAKENGDLGKVRTRREISIRRELSADQKQPQSENEKIEAAPTADLEPLEAIGPLEVDPTIEADEGIEVDMELPKLQYRSTRSMRNRMP